MKVRIVSEGHPATTRVYNAETGEEMRGIVAIRFDEITVKGGPLRVTLECSRVALDVVAEAEIQPAGFDANGSPVA